jgi:hypothetical protein
MPPSNPIPQIDEGEHGEMRLMSDGGTPLPSIYCRNQIDEGDPGGVGDCVNRGESPGGASPWTVDPLPTNHPGRGGFGLTLL